MSNIAKRRPNCMNRLEHGLENGSASTRAGYGVALCLGNPASTAVANRQKGCQRTRAMKRNSTIDDVATAAGVARVTVSRVLNKADNVRPETRERVLRAVETLGYSVNYQARALA